MADRIYVIAGKDESLVGARAQELVDELLDSQQRMTALLSVEGDEAVVSEVLDELKTVPFLADKRVVLVRGADGFVSRHREILERYFEKPASTGVLVLAVSSWDARTRLSKMLPKVGSLITMEAPPKWKLPEHMVHYAATKHKIKLNRDAAEMLVELIGEELAQLYNELEKLVLFARDEKVIRADHVESLIGHQRIFGAFEVIDAMMGGNTGQAVTRLRNMFEQDKSAEYSVVGAFAFHLRRMFQAKTLLEKRTSPEIIAKQLRVGFHRDRFFAQLQRTTLSQIAAFLEELAAVDHATKTGQAQATVAIEQLVLRLAGAAPPGARP
ncbi:MAG TPA: DNA polymerase III subunit delta [Sedimentisphaerales bacterium]|jgi:DNA polymerase-3 subunit delta|nr:DNA polymerase III subunit delta [Sedimentisphaerales bacterium]HNU31683.1 DNA polymerase III subunit delta [Sedimentisphaerales bacterium]